MKYTIEVKVPEKKRTLFGEKTVYRIKRIEVDRETYLEHQKKNRRDEGFSIEEMMFYDDLIDDD